MGNNEKVSKEHRKAEALGNRAYYLEKIREQQSAIESEAKFEAYSEYQLDQKRKRIQQLFENFEKKCADLKCVDQADYPVQQNSETEEICDRMMAKIDDRMKVLKKASEAVQAKAGLENYTIPKLQQATEIQASPAQASPVQTIPESRPSEAIEVQGFDGNLAKWYAFRDDFDEKVSAKSIDDATKLAILKRSCTGDVHINVPELNGSDFQDAWSRLEEAFGSAYTQMQFWLYKLATIPGMKEASAESIRSLLEKAKKCVTNMSKMMRPEQFECLVVATISQRLDQQTKHIWERHRNALAVSWAAADDAEQSPKKKAIAHIPAWNDMHDFLVSEAKIYQQSEIQAKFHRNKCDASVSSSFALQNIEQLDQATRYTTPATPQVENTRTAQVISVQQHAAETGMTRRPKASQPPFLQCTLCTGVHPRFKCEVYKVMDYYEKWAHINAEWLCGRCVRPAHSATRCEDRNCENPCPQCETYAVTRYHNSTLCPLKHGIDPTVHIQGIDDWSL